MRQDELVIGQLDPELGPGQDGNDLTLYFDCFFGIHGDGQAGALFRAPASLFKLPGNRRDPEIGQDVLPEAGLRHEELFANSANLSRNINRCHFPA